jgi:predicted nucleotidyltransferase
LEKALEDRLKTSTEEIKDFCRRWQIVELALFGSVLRDDFKPESDVDVLVVFASEAHPTLFDLVQMEGDLEKAFGRKVDLLTRSGVESSRNPLRRKSILGSSRVIYGA